MNRRKKFTAMALLTVLFVSILLGGTYAWRSVSQKVLNEAKSSLNPGGRLHDDFNGLNLSSTQTTDDDDDGRKVKYVYVENFTEKDNGDQIYARIRLDEYLEKGVGAGKATNDLSKLAKPLVPDATLEDKESWTPYQWGSDRTFRDYVTLSTGGDTVYMPTFNKDKDSLTADINGTLAGLDKDVETIADDYSDYVKYIYDETDANTSKVTDIEVYDAAGDGLDKIRNVGLDIETIKAAVKDPVTGRFKVTPGASSIVINGTSYEVTRMEPDVAAGGGALTASDITAIHVDLDQTTTGATSQADIVLRLAEHTAKKTLETLKALDGTDTPGIISMDEWTTTYGSQRGQYWVYDSEGWLYWAAPIEPDTATGCLLNGISINDSSLLNEEYYYGLNVVAEFASAGDWGDQVEATGFYERGLTPEGKKLLDIISSDSGITYEIEMTPDEISSGLMQSSTATFEAAVYELAGGERTRLTDVGADAFTWEVLTVSDAARTAEHAATTSRIEASTEAGKATLRIGADEQNTELIVRVTYEEPSSHKTAEKEVRVSNIEKTKVEISDFTIEGTFAADGEHAFKVYPNSTLVFTATAAKTDGTGTIDVTDQLQWSLDGERTDSDTSLNESSRTLSIGENERSKELTVTAAYNDPVTSRIYTKSYRITEILTAEYEVSIDSGVSEIEDGDTRSFTASVSWISGPEAGTQKTDAQISWSVVDASTSKALKSGTRIDQNGNLSVAVGETASQLKIIASYGNASASKTITVNRISYSIEITPDLTSSSLMQNATQEFTATVYKHQGDTKTALTNVSAGEMEWNVNQGRGVTLSSDTTMTKVSSNPLKASFHVGYDEQNTSIHILATYTSPLNKKAEATQQINIEKSSIEIMLTIVGGEHVNVSDGVIKAYPGKTIAFRATAKRIDGAETTDVTNQLQWSLEGNNTDSNTNLNTGSALLSIGAGERSMNLAVTVTYADSVNYKIYTKSYRITEILTTKYGVSIDSGASRIEIGETQSYTASVSCLNGSAAGTKKSDAKVSWSVVDASTSKAPESGTTIDQNGNLSVAAGETASQLKITASYGGASTSKTITVNATYSIEVTPDLTSSSLVQNATQELTAMVYKQQGSTKTEVTSIGANDLTWEFVNTPTSGTSLTKLSTNNRKASLHVAENETKESLSIRVVYTDALNRTGEKTIQIAIQDSTYELSDITYDGNIEKINTVSGYAEKNCAIVFSATLKKTDGTGTSVISADNIQWSLSGNPTSEATSFDAATRTFKAGTDETAKNLQIKAAYQDMINNRSYEKTFTIKEFLTYQAVMGMISTTMVQDDSHSLPSIMLKRTNGANKNTVVKTYTAKSAEWEISGSQSVYTKISGQFLAVGIDEKAETLTLKATVVYGGISYPVEKVITIDPLEYVLEIGFEDSSLEEVEAGGKFYYLTQSLTRANGQSKGTAGTISKLEWQVEGSDVPEGRTKSYVSEDSKGYYFYAVYMEGSESLTIKASCTGYNGNAATLKEPLQLRVNPRTKLQRDLYAASDGDTVEIDGEQYYRVCYTSKDLDEDDVTEYAWLVWKAEPIEGYTSIFGDTNVWRDSPIRTYLDTEFVDDNPTIKQAIKDGIIPTATITTRKQVKIASSADSNFIKTEDEIFLLSCADFSEKLYYLSDDNDENTAEMLTLYKKERTAGALLSTFVDEATLTKMKAFTEKGTSEKTWYRAPRRHKGYVSTGNAAGTVYSTKVSKSYGVRPAFWVRVYK